MLPNDVLSLGAPASSPASASRLAPVARSLLLLLAAGCGSAPHASDQAPIGEWRHYAADRASTKYSPLDQIDPSNVDQLREVWRWTSVETEADTEHRGGMYKSTPLYIDGVLYITTSLSQVAAIDPGTGETLWVYDPRSYDAGRPANAGFQQRGLEYWSGEIDGEAVERLIYAAHHRRLISLDRLTGEPDPAFGDGGMVNTAVGLGREINERQYTHSAPPIVCADVIVLGSIVSDGPRGPKMPPGHVRGYDARTGEQRWIFHTIPRPGEFGNETWLDGSWEYSGNTNVWTMMSCDDELGFVYLPVSTPTNDWYVRHGLWDYDLASAPNLVDVTVDGRRIKAVAQVSKQGITYVFDRETGEPVWPIEDVVILHQLGGPATAQQVPAPAPGQVVVLGADGQPAGEASVTVLLPGRGGVSPADEILVRSGTADNGVVANAVPRLHGLTLVVDHPTHLPLLASTRTSRHPVRSGCRLGGRRKGSSGKPLAALRCRARRSASPGATKACPTGSEPCGAARKAVCGARSSWRVFRPVPSGRRLKRPGSIRIRRPSSRGGGPHVSSSNSWPEENLPRRRPLLQPAPAKCASNSSAPPENRSATSRCGPTPSAGWAALPMTSRMPRVRCWCRSALPSASIRRSTSRSGPRTTSSLRSSASRPYPAVRSNSA
ncbi:MAG: PQQ-binding-like beta-propeller repeat protein [Acidobacteriota bacterium]|nr:PQQ-binding-like beta-propeller repeat protein [Acidobacteriota bacterium]